MSNEPNESSGEYINTLYGRKPPRAKLPWIPIAAIAGVLVLISAVIFRATLTTLSFADGAYGIGLGAGYVLLTERKRVWQWWRRVRPWGWETVRDTGITCYQVHPSGKRRAVHRPVTVLWGVSPGGFGKGEAEPIDRGWVETGEWTTHKIRGHWPDGNTATATASGDGEWRDDHFGQAFGLLDDSIIGCGDKARTVADTADSFWDGCERVERVTECAHSLTFDPDTARDMCAAKVRLKYPRLFGECPKGCGFSGIAYVSQEHYVAGDW